MRLAGAADARDVGRLLHDFNSEYDEPTPGPAALARRVRELLAREDFDVLLVGDGPDGLAVLRFRPAIWDDAPECYLAELYVAPAERGRGLGRALMEAALALARERSAGHIDLNTAKTDVAARALYERLGFTNHEGGPDGPVSLYYERRL